jgi:arylsulfate sulfotransferase
MLACRLAVPNIRDCILETAALIFLPNPISTLLNSRYFGPFPGVHTMKRSFGLLLRGISLAAVPCFLVACGSSAPRVVATAHPLVAQYSLTPGQAGDLTVEFGTDTSYGRQTASFPVTRDWTPVLVAGMTPSTTYHMRAQLSVAGSVVWTDQDRVFTTAAIPPNLLPVINVTTTSDSALLATENPGVESITFLPPTTTPTIEALVTNRDGTPIWYYNPPGTVGWFKLMPTGHMLVETTPNLVSTITEIDLAGATIRQLAAPTLQQELQQAGYNMNFLSFSHDFIPMANGHLIVLGQTSQDFTNLPGFPGTTTVLGDVLVDLDENWNPVWTWNAFDYLDVNRHPMQFPDWTHSNAVLYNPNDGNLLLSMRHQNWLLYIDYQNGAGSGNLLWRLGEGGDYTLTNTTDVSQWFYAQHFPSFVNINGSQITLALFDNGNDRMNADGTNCEGAPYPACYSRATIFQLDQSTMQAQLLWQYLPGLFSFWGGAINQLQNGNVEFEMSEPFPLPTPGARAMEVTQTDDPQVVWQMDLPGGQSYRTYRIPSLYPNITWP